jgi:hypothetical protein
MAYVYLLDLYKMIDERIEDAKAAVGNIDGNPAERKYHEGRIQALLDFREFLNRRLHPKLPRRIRETIKTKF